MQPILNISVRGKTGDNKDMKILVIGGTKFFGIPMVHALLMNGHDVTIATRGNTLDPFGNSVTRIEMDRQNPDMVKNKLSGKCFDVVIDKVAYCSNDIKSLFDYMKCNRYIMMSTMSVYKEEHLEIREEEFNAAKYPLKWCDRKDYDYGEVKRQAECAVCQVYPEMDHTFVRYPVVLGKNDYTERLLFYIDHIIHNKPMFIDDRKKKMSFIEEKEAGKFIAWLVDNKIEGPVNGCSIGTICMEDVISYIEKRTGKKAIIAALGDVAPYNGFENDMTLNTEKASKKGYQFTEMDRWLYDLIDWYIKK